ncbi:MAG: FAD-binding oxidoreductase, partial [Polyangiaceae bacterium]|nr:FAD-binding oxidoreductase [Polyangiaceae bacterium]
MALERDLKLRFPHLLVSTNPVERTQYSRDLWPRRLLELRAHELPATTPLVVWPRRTEEVGEILQFAKSASVRVVPFGAGSGVCGAILPDASTIVMDLKRMDAFAVHENGQFVDVAPGVMGLPLEEELQRRGFTIGHFPSSIVCSTVGGWIAARGAGQCSGRYGKIEDMVAGLEVVTGASELVKARYRQSATNLLPLLIGSEGTLGILTGATLRLHPNPSARRFMAFDFSRMEQGMAALRSVFQHGLRPAVTRLYDPLDSWLFDQSAKKKHGAQGGMLKALKSSALRTALQLTKLGFGAVQAVEGLDLVRSLLILVFEGTEAEVAADAERALGYCRAEGGENRGEEPAKRWFGHRYDVSFKQSGVFEAGAFSDTFEIAATWSNLKPAYDAIRSAISEEALVLAHLSHAYPDGCSIYFTFVGAARGEAASLEKYDRIWRRALSAALGAGATISHHHGVGRSKLSFLEQEWGAGGSALQQALRQAWDPSGLLNPGNLKPSSAHLPNARAQGEPRNSGSELPGIQLDEASLTVSVNGNVAVGEVARFIESRGLELAFSETCSELPVAQWVAQGMPGALDFWADPVTQPLNG